MKQIENRQLRCHYLYLLSLNLFDSGDTSMDNARASTSGTAGDSSHDFYTFSGKVADHLDEGQYYKS